MEALTTELMEALTTEAPQSRTIPFRSAVAGFLSGVLGRDVRARSQAERGSGGSHLELPGTSVRVTSGFGTDIGVSLQAAIAASHHENRPLAVVISQRRGRDIANSYAVMTLSHYSQLLSVASEKGLDHE